MEFRSLKRQYELNKGAIDEAIANVINDSRFISGPQVNELEEKLSAFVGTKHCITCANGTDALLLALMAWGIGVGDAVFVPDFTFFSTGEVVSAVGATPVFVDVTPDTFNIDSQTLDEAIDSTIKEGRLVPRVIIAVDLFGQAADYNKLKTIAQKHNLMILEDGAQGFGGRVKEHRNCSFGDISTTSFFPMKPLGCYGDGGAVFTDNDEWADLIRSYCVHGKGTMKYDNVRIGMNSRLDTIQAAVLLAKFDVFVEKELTAVDRAATMYTTLLSSNLGKKIKTPVINEGVVSAWAQYTITLENREFRDSLKNFLLDRSIPSMVYYPKPMHVQKAFSYLDIDIKVCPVTSKLCDTVLSLPISPYIKDDEIENVVAQISDFCMRTLNYGI